MAALFARLIQLHRKTIEDVPEELREQVEELLTNA